MKIFYRLTKHLNRAVALVAIFAQVFIGPSGANFGDWEFSQQNTIASSALDLTVSASAFTQSTFKPGEAATSQVTIQNDGVLPFAYSQQYVYESGDQTLCDELEMTATYHYFNGTTTQDIIKYQGLLKDFDLNLPADPDEPDSLLPNPARPYFANPDYSANQHHYTYEISLPADADIALINQTCSFGFEYYAWQPEIGAPLVGFWDKEGLASQTLSTGDWVPESTIKGYKRDEAGNGLGGWQIVVHDTRIDPFQSLTVLATNPDPVTTNPLEEGKVYLIEASGTWTNQNGARKVDADYYSDDDWTNHADFDDDNSRDPRQLDLVINDQDVAWGTYQSNHLYKTIYVGEGSPIDLRIFDEDQDPNKPSWYNDNEGSLSVRIYDVTNEIITTNDTGYFEKTVKSDKPYQLLEVMQLDWEAVSPQNYYHVNLPVDNNQEFIFVNKKVSYNLVINEVYYDVDDAHGTDGGSSQSDEWVELYNPNNFAVNLKDWSLIDNTTTRSISNRNVYIPAKGFAVIAKAAQTWTHWTIPSDAITIEIGDTIGEGLANTGDRIILKNAIGEEVDAVSWGSNTYAFGAIPAGYQNKLITGDGKSIARSPLGYDTDSHTNWVIVDTPNPGTNPHSHIKVNLSQSENNELLVTFTNAVGFNALKYALTYQHEFEGQSVTEIINGEATKTTGDQELTLAPIYLGTCSTDGLVCTPHLNITGVQLNLMYKVDTEIIGTSTIDYNWQNEHE